MSQKINAPDTLKLLPAFMRKDEANIALAKATDELIKDHGSRVRQLRIWDQIDELPEYELDELAWELGIDWYKTSMSLEAKRSTIKNARAIKSHRGTKFAVEQLVSSYLGSGVVLEWFDFGGKPFTFYICTTEDVGSTDVYNEFVRAANAAKSARSRLLGVFSYMESRHTVKVRHDARAAAFCYIKAGTLPHFQNVGSLDGIAVVSAPETEPGTFGYTQPGETALTGGRPHVQNVGGLNDNPAQSGPEAIPAAFTYARCGTRICGT